MSDLDSSVSVRSTGSRARRVNTSVLVFVSDVIFSNFPPSPFPCLVLGVYEVREGAQLLQLVLVIVGLDKRSVVVANFVESVLWWGDTNNDRWKQPKHDRWKYVGWFSSPQPFVSAYEKVRKNPERQQYVPASVHCGAGKSASTHLERKYI